QGLQLEDLGHVASDGQGFDVLDPADDGTWKVGRTHVVTGLIQHRCTSWRPLEEQAPCQETVLPRARRPTVAGNRRRQERLCASVLPHLRGLGREAAAR